MHYTKYIFKLLCSFLPCRAFLWRVTVMKFNATFNKTSAISWWSVLLMEEIGVPGENHRPATSHWRTLSRNVVLSTPRHKRNLTSQQRIYTDCIGSCKSNYHTIATRFLHIANLTKYMWVFLRIWKIEPFIFHKVLCVKFVK